MTTFEEALANAVSVLPVGVKNHPGVFVEIFNGLAQVAATDGYVYVSTMVSVPQDVAVVTFLSKAQAKDLVGSEDIWGVLTSMVPVIDEEARGNLEALRYMALVSDYDISTQRLRYVPDRVKKLGALKPQGEFVDIFPAAEQGTLYARFVYGKHTIGVFTLLDPEEGAHATV